MRNSILILLSLILLNCSPEDSKEENLTCFRCSYSNFLPDECNESLAYEACVIGYYNNSTLEILEIRELCNGEEKSKRERNEFLQVFLETHINAGADCQEF